MDSPKYDGVAVVVQRAMRHTSPETNCRYQLRIAEQVRQAVEKVDQRLYGERSALHFITVSRS